MPRPNKQRNVLAEANLARRIATERDARGWTNDGLAKRMTDAGCAMTGSAIFKIEKGEPRRRIVVDEFVAFAKVFGVSVEALLLPPEAAVEAHITLGVIEWNRASNEADVAIKTRDEAWDRLANLVADSEGASEAAASVFASWAAARFDPEHREGARAYQMWNLTKDDKWLEIVKADIGHG